VAAEAQAHKDRADSQGQKLQHLESEVEEQRCQSRQLLESLQACQSDIRRMEAENRLLRDFQEGHEMRLAREEDLLAQAGGHNNHRQKIQLLAQIKTDNQTLRSELKKAKLRLAQLQVETPRLLGCLAGVPQEPWQTLSVSSRQSGAGIGLEHSEASPPLSRTRRRRSVDTGLEQITASPKTVRSVVRAEEDRTIERLRVDHQHLLCLLERVLLDAGGKILSSENEVAIGCLTKLRNLADGEPEVSSIQA